MFGQDEVDVGFGGGVLCNGGGFLFKTVLAKGRGHLRTTILIIHTTPTLIPITTIILKPKRLLLNHPPTHKRFIKLTIRIGI